VSSFSLLVILSAAKDLGVRPARSFAALRMTSLISKYLIEGRILLFVAVVAVVAVVALVAVVLTVKCSFVG
jgi:hypothetical protein